MNRTIEIVISDGYDESTEDISQTEKDRAIGYLALKFVGCLKKKNARIYCACDGAIIATYRDINDSVVYVIAATIKVGTNVYEFCS